MVGLLARAGAKEKKGRKERFNYFQYLMSVGSSCSSLIWFFFFETNPFFCSAIIKTRKSDLQFKWHCLRLHSWLVHPHPSHYVQIGKKFSEHGTCRCKRPSYIHTQLYTFVFYTHTYVVGSTWLHGLANQLLLCIAERQRSPGTTIKDTTLTIIQRPS